MSILKILGEYCKVRLGLRAMMEMAIISGRIQEPMATSPSMELQEPGPSPFLQLDMKTVAGLSQ